PTCVTSNIKLFADNSLLYHRISSGEDSVCLQEDMDKLQEWEKTWTNYKNGRRHGQTTRMGEDMDKLQEWEKTWTNYKNGRRHG
ncbi:hypothetical protein LSAT2_016157, partial [Lamellibrachia satsuma]